MEHLQNHAQSTDFGDVRLFKQIGPCQLVFSLQSLNMTETGLLLTSKPEGFTKDRVSFEGFLDIFQPSQTFTLQIEPPDQSEKEPFLIEASLDYLEEKNGLYYMSLSFLKSSLVLNAFLDEINPDRHIEIKKTDQTQKSPEPAAPQARKRFPGF